MTEKLLSICIPTYKNKEFLKENITTIVSQITPDIEGLVEICVSDNASGDGTLEDLQYFAQTLKTVDFRYSVNEKNLGADTNFILAMKMGTGRFLWLLGSDDLLVEGALQKILKQVSGNTAFDLMLFNRVDCTYDMKPLYNRYWLVEEIPTTVFDFADKFQEGCYYGYGKDTGALFSFISSYVFKREAVTLFEFDPSYIGTSYSFLYYIFRYLKTGKKVLYYNEHLVYCRLGNSAFAAVIAKRIKRDYDAYTKIRNDFFAKDDVNAPIYLRNLKRTYPFFKIMEVYALVSKSSWDTDFVPLLKLSGWSEKELRAMRVLLNPVMKALFKARINLKELKSKKIRF